MAEILTLAKGESITWILVIAFIAGIWYLAKFTRDFVNNTIQKFESQLKAQTNKSEKREEQLNEQLNKSIDNNSRIINSIEKLENMFNIKFDCLNNEIKEIKENIN